MYVNLDIISIKNAFHAFLYVNHVPCGLIIVVNAKKMLGLFKADIVNVCKDM